MAAMLFALTSPNPSISLDDFNRWYDERHAHSRAVCPCVHSVSRFQLIDRGQDTVRVGEWTWLAVYELENAAALQTQQYRKAREEDGDDESKMFDFLSRRVYKQLRDERAPDYAAQVSTGEKRYLSMPGFEPAECVSFHDYSETVKQECVTTVSKRHGWLRSSIWQLQTAADPRDWQEQTNVPKLLLLHEWNDSAASSHRADTSLGQADSNDVARVQEKAFCTLWRQF